MKYAILIAVSVILLLAALVGATVMGYIPDSMGLRPLLGVEKPSENAEAPKAPVAETPLERLGPPPLLLYLKSISVPVIVEGQLRKTANINFRIEIDPDQRDILAKRGHLLMAVYLQELMILLPQQLEASDSFDFAAIKRRLKELSNEVLEPDSDKEVVRDVIIQGYYER